mgnify:FL=1|jgi:hypothetical protein
MKKTFLMTLIALSISGMSCAQSDTENTAKKQETVQQQFVKERREQAKMAKNLIEQKVLKDAKKQAKQLKKEGWQPAPGTLPLEKQLTDVYTRMYTYEGRFPKYFIGRSSGRSTSAGMARKQALTRARVDVASQMKLEVAALTEETDMNTELSAGEVETVAKMVDTSQTMIQQSLGRTEVVLDIMRTTGGKTESQVAVSYDGNLAKETLLSIFEKEDAQIKQKLQDLLNK